MQTSPSLTNEMIAKKVNM